MTELEQANVDLLKALLEHEAMSRQLSSMWVRVRQLNDKVERLSAQKDEQVTA